MTKKEVQIILKSIIDNGDQTALKVLWSAAKKYNLIEAVQSSSIPLQSQKESLYRLVYTSARSSNCDESNIQKILQSSRQNNPALGITGLLIYTENRFLQIIEGPLDNVMNLYEKIEKDSRHAGSNLRYCEPTLTRHFSDWNMAEKNISISELKYKAEISMENQQIYKSLIDGDLHSYKDDGIRVLKAFLSIN